MAAQSFERVLQLDPDNVVAKSEIGWIHYLQGQYEEAEAKLREAVQTTESPRAVDMYRLGRIYYDMGGMGIISESDSTMATSERYASNPVIMAFF